MIILNPAAQPLDLLTMATFTHAKKHGSFVNETPLNFEGEIYDVVSSPVARYSVDQVTLLKRHKKHAPGRMHSMVFLTKRVMDFHDIDGGGLFMKALSTASFGHDSNGAREEFHCVPLVETPASLRRSYQGPQEGDDE